MFTQNRIDRIRNYMEEDSIDTVIVSNPENQYYLTGFRALMYSRPIITIINRNDISIIVPGIEETHAMKEANVDSIHVYYEHPESIEKDQKAATDILQKLLNNLAVKRVGIEDGFLSYGVGKQLASKYNIVGVTNFILKMRLIKDKNEFLMLQKAGKLVSGAVQATLSSLAVGKTELEVEDIGNRHVLEEASRSYPDSTIDFFTMTPSGPERSTMPHLLSSTRRFTEQDIGIHTRQIGLHGYRAECERTFFIGNPTDEQSEIFNIMVEAQKSSVKKCIPGNLLKDIDQAARSIIQKAGYGNHSIHRTGHGIGLEAHEAPSIRFDCYDRLETGMVITIEPGIYVPGIGGFRHSDTFIITEQGPKQITEANCLINQLTF